MRLFAFVFIAVLLFSGPEGRAQSLGGAFQIEWKVANRFRFFDDPALFRMHDVAWRQYMLKLGSLDYEAETKERLAQQTAVLGSEHVLNDRYIAFSNILRTRYDWRGWAARSDGRTCWDPGTRRHSACGGIDAYLNPTSHEIEVWLSAVSSEPLPKSASCLWMINGTEAGRAPCGEKLGGISLPYPDGGEISVSIGGAPAISLSAKVRDLLIVGMGDSFASGEGNPDVPVAFAAERRYRNLYPARAGSSDRESAKWQDRLCHRSLYSHQLRVALHIGIENPHVAVTYLGYSCSGAGIEKGILGAQEYVEREALKESSAVDGAAPAPYVQGDRKDAQLRRLLSDLCRNEVEREDGFWICPGKAFRRHVDYLLLSAGGNDVGFANVVAWVTLRPSTSARLARFFGATVTAKQFARNVRDILPDAYANLGKALEKSVPLYSSPEDSVFDASRVVLTAYPDVLVDENGNVCAAGPDEGGEDSEHRYAANQSLDGFSSWLAAGDGRLKEVHAVLAELDKRMGDIAGDMGWTFAGRIYADKGFTGHGFCARNSKKAGDPAEMLMLPCWGDADEPTRTCQQSWSGQIKRWRPYDPSTQNYPYALRQRWVRTFNDAFMTVNQKVITRNGKIDEKASAATFSETTGAMHPTAEGQAAMADAILMDLRPMVARDLQAQ
jgi:lysophospholipase L1-like esterase